MPIWPFKVAYANNTKSLQRNYVHASVVCFRQAKFLLLCASCEWSGLRIAPVLNFSAVVPAAGCF